MYAGTYAISLSVQLIARAKSEDFTFCFIFVSATRRRRNIKMLFAVGPRAEKFNTVSNDHHGRTHKFDFSIFNRKYPEIWYQE